MDLEKEHEDLKSQWAALEQKLKHTKTQTESYKVCFALRGLFARKAEQ